MAKKDTHQRPTRKRARLSGIYQNPARHITAKVRTQRRKYEGRYTSN